MSGVQLVLGWAVTALWFVIWEVLPGRRRHLGPREALGHRVLLELGAESLLLTLFAALWFGSLGHGGWPLLFAVLGLLIALPPRLRARHHFPIPSPLRWGEISLDVLRLVVAGGLLAWRL
jgi:hypothetical protein